ncbi:MAG: hypothetical protein ACT4N2_12290, partial [Hyphomicrobium sp.]
YEYDLEAIERNHEAFANEGTVATTRAVKAMLRPAPPVRETPRKSPTLALPLPRGRDSRAEAADPVGKSPSSRRR